MLIAKCRVGCQGRERESGGRGDKRATKILLNRIGTYKERRIERVSSVCVTGCEVLLETRYWI